ncbi:MAG: urea amidolyase family protein [Lautropia sp.]|nr:urea amidolyase family protein [Lautropia sp.]
MRVLPVNLDTVLVEMADLAETLALFDALQAEPIAGVTEMVPAARTILIGFEPALLNAASLVMQLERRQCGKVERTGGEVLQLPVCYDGEDLAEMADYLGVSVAELIRRHGAAIWQVAFIGFAPGFPYMSGDDPLFDVPRRSSPRTRIPAGSVALAGRFCGIYPRATPGGWQLLGTTDVPIWDLRRAPPALLPPGQRVRFVDVASEAGAALQAAWRERLAGRPKTEAAYGAGEIEPVDSKTVGDRQFVSSGAASDGQRHSVDTAQTGSHQTPTDAKGLIPLRQASGEGVPVQSPEPARLHDVSTGHPPAANEPMPVFEVVDTGLQALFQDLGRPGLAGQGISASGALDRGACVSANRLVGNARSATVLELLHGGFALRVLQPAVAAVTGAAGPITLRHADGTALPVHRWVPFSLEAGDLLNIGAPEAGLRTYLAVRGGFEVEPVLGSCATDTLAGVGPVPLQAGQSLFVAGRTVGAVQPHPDLPPPDLPRSIGDPVLNAVTLDVVLGPRTDWFDDESLGLLQSQYWQVSLQSNRVGLRLAGDRPLQRAPVYVGVELPSEGTVVGALQVPTDGQPVLFLADHPLTGGYPVIGCVAPHHLDLAGQLPAGVMIRFRVMTAFEEVTVS